MNHEWLATDNSETMVFSTVRMPKGNKEVPQFEAQDNNNNIIASLNKIIKEKDEEINKSRQ